MEEAWDRATEPNPDLTSGEPHISPQVYQTEAPLEDVLAPPQFAESLVRVGDLFGWVAPLTHSYSVLKLLLVPLVTFTILVVNLAC